MAEHPPEHWAKLAAEVREQAKEMSDPVIRSELERLAEGYDRANPSFAIISGAVAEDPLRIGTLFVT